MLKARQRWRTRGSTRDCFWDSCRASQEHEDPAESLHHTKLLKSLTNNEKSCGSCQPHENSHRCSQPNENAYRAPQPNESSCGASQLTQGPRVVRLLETLAARSCVTRRLCSQCRLLALLFALPAKSALGAPNRPNSAQCCVFPVAIALQWRPRPCR